jgi:single-strand DNA-binding protein
MANFNFNKAILGGRLVADPELKTTSNGTPVTSFSIAVNRTRTKEEEITDFINIVAWRGTAEFICKYFHKGSSICIVGDIQTRNWTTDSGEKRYATEVVAKEAFFVDSKSDGGNASSGGVTYVPDAYMGNSAPAFEEIADDDTLPF